MKLNNLSRLTALLLALMMLPLAAFSESIDNATGDLLATYNSVTEFLEAMAADNKCSLCAETLGNRGLLSWPVDGFDCLHTYLGSLTSNEAYQLLYDLDRGTSEEYTLSQVYINAHNSHVDDTTEELHRDAVICYGFDCYKNPLTVPGPSHVEGICPWYQETEYVPTSPVTTDKDVSTPDALKTVTEVTLSFITGESYAWQKGTLDATTGAIVWDEANPVTTTETYTLSITPASLAYAYRCVVTAADGTQTISSTVYLGGETFFTWASTAENVQTWLTTATHVTMEYVFLAYEKFMQTPSIALDDVIHMNNTELIELLNGTTLATLDENNQLIDTRYHIAVATYNATTGVITALATD